MKKRWIRLICMVLCIAFMTGGVGRDAFADFQKDGIDWWLGRDELRIYGTEEMKTLLPNNEWGWQSEVLAFPKVVIDDGIKSIGDYALFDCYFIESIEIPASVTSIGNYAFYNCKSLKEISIPAGVTSIGNYAFYGCEALKSVAIPAGAQIGECAFDACGDIEITTLSESGSMKITSDEGHRWGNLTWTLDEKGTLTISGSGEMENYNANDDDNGWNSYVYTDQIRNAVICEGVTSIGMQAFKDCIYLESVTIPESVTSIGKHAFIYCEALESITIPNHVASIGDNPFYGCEKLSNISVSVENPYLEVIDGVLFSKQDKRLVWFPAMSSDNRYFVPEGTKIIGADAFYSSIVMFLAVPDSVETIGNVPLSRRQGHISIDISDENPYLEKVDGVLFDKQHKKLIGSSVILSGKYTIPEGTETIGDNAFVYCDGLTSVEIPDSVTSIGNGAFSACQSLESINIPDSVTNIGEFAFGGCFSLKSVAIPDSVTSIGNEAFEACIALESINIPDGVTSIGMGAFFSCQSLKSIVIPDSVTSIGTRAFECCSALESVSIPFTVLEVAKESWKYFDDASILKSFICRIPDGVTAIGSGAFSNCRGLTSVTIPDSVIAMGNGVFSGCSDSLVVNVFQGSVAEQYCEENGINHIGDQVSSVNMKSGWLSDNVYWRMNNDSDGTVTVFGDGVLDGYGLKSQNSIIKALVIEEGITGNYYDVLPGYAAGWPGYFDYEGFPNLTSITIPNSMATIDAKLLSDCPDLSLVNISADHPTLEIAEGGLYSKPDQKLIRCLSDAESFAVREGTKIIGTSAFRNCEKLTSIIIPESVTIIGGGAFENCASLKSITIPEGVCNIRDYMFIDCSALSSVTIPESVINIGWGAFQNCYSLKEITIPDSVHIINESIFGYGSLFYGSATLNVNLGSYAEQFCQRMGAPYKSFVHVPLDKAGLSVSTKDGAASISAGKKLQMIAAFDNPDLINRNNKNDEVIWSAVNTETGETVPAAAIDAKGQLTIDKNLNETVQLIVTGESALYGTKSTAVITAVPVVKKVIADPAELFFYVGIEEVQTVIASTEPSMVLPAGFLTWTPAKKDIVEITESEDGVVSIKPLKAGKTDITVKEPGGKNAKVKVNVVDPVETVELAVNGNAKAGGKVNITAALAPKTAGNKTVEYSLDVGEDIATINEKGQLSISKEAPSGTKITVTCTALGAPAPVTATVVVEVP